MSVVYESPFAVAFAAAPLFLAQARQLSHDTVIRTAGRARRSGVTWTHRPLSEWRAAMDELGIYVDPNRIKPDHDLENQAERYPDGVLVIATVEVDPDVRP